MLCTLYDPGYGCPDGYEFPFSELNQLAQGPVAVLSAMCSLLKSATNENISSQWVGY